MLGKTTVDRPIAWTLVALASAVVVTFSPGAATTAQAGGLSCRKVVGKPSGEGVNGLKASRARCSNEEFLTGGVCYPEVRPEPDGSCQTSAMGIIQTLAEWPQSTRGAFYTCLQTGGSECAVEERTRAMAICCRMDDEAAEKDGKSE